METKWVWWKKLYSADVLAVYRTHLPKIMHVHVALNLQNYCFKKSIGLFLWTQCTYTSVDTTQSHRHTHTHTHTERENLFAKYKWRAARQGFRPSCWPQKPSYTEISVILPTIKFIYWLVAWFMKSDLYLDLHNFYEVAQFTVWVFHSSF